MASNLPYLLANPQHEEANLTEMVDAFDMMFGNWEELNQPQYLTMTKHVFTAHLRELSVTSSPEAALAEKLADAIMLKANNKLDKIPIPLYDQVIGYANSKLPEDATKFYQYKDPRKAGHVGRSGSSGSLNCGGGECEVPITLNGLWGYGCHCNFGGELMTGHGTPVNDHDEICMNLQNCLRCVVIDDEADGQPNNCDPKTEEFSIVSSFFSPDQAIANDCSTANNNDPCKSHACTCEVKFISALIEKMFDQYVYDPAYLHADQGGNFDPTAPGSCGANTGGPLRNKVCCGAYPTRYPYITQNRQCCDNDQTLFNPLSQQCCPNGVEDIGEVC